MSGVAIEVGLQLIDACQIGDTGIGTGAAFADSRDGLRQVAVRVGELNAGHGKHDQQHRQREPTALEYRAPTAHGLKLITKRNRHAGLV